MWTGIAGDGAAVLCAVVETRRTPANARAKTILLIPISSFGALWLALLAARADGIERAVNEVGSVLTQRARRRGRRWAIRTRQASPPRSRTADRALARAGFARQPPALLHRSRSRRPRHMGTRDVAFFRPAGSRLRPLPDRDEDALGWSAARRHRPRGFISHRSTARRVHRMRALTGINAGSRRQAVRRQAVP